MSQGLMVIGWDAPPGIYRSVVEVDQPQLLCNHIAFDWRFFEFWAGAVTLRSVDQTWFFFHRLSKTAWRRTALGIGAPIRDWRESLNIMNCFD